MFTSNIRMKKIYLLSIAVGITKATRDNRIIRVARWLTGLFTEKEKHALHPL